MDKNNLPSLRRDRHETEEMEGGNIFANTAVDLHTYSQNKQSNGYKGVKDRNRLNVSKKAPNATIAQNNMVKSNNFLNTKTDDMTTDLSFKDPTLERKLVPLGYFDRSPNTVASPSDLNTTSRYSENKIASSVEFPHLNRTLRTETLYSLKSQQNTSPHARIMQTLEKKKINKAVKKLPDSNQNVRSHENLIQINKKIKSVPVAKNANVTRNAHNNTKQYYEITTIDEDDESSTQQQFYNNEHPSVHPSNGYAK